jgi:hypothetical protein
MALTLSGYNSSSFSESNGYYVYALRRDENDMLWFTKVSSASTTETSLDLNYRKDGSQIVEVSDYQDYVEETTEEKTLTNHPQDKYQQIRFDKRNLNYFVDNDGYFVIQVNGTYDYNTIGPK